MQFDFNDLTPQSTSVRLAGKDYVLVEADAGVVAAYDNRKMVDAVLSEDGVVARLPKLADLRPFLVSLCLHPADWDRKTPRQPDQQAEFEQYIRGLPDRVVDPLYDWVTEHSPTILGKQSVEELERQKERVDRALDRAKNSFDPKG